MNALLLRVLDRLKIRYSPDPIQGRIWGLCPYHKDRHASWMIRSEGTREGQHHCFACKNGGSLAELVSHIRGISLSSAMEWLKEMGANSQQSEEVIPPAETIVVQEISSPFAPEFKMPPGVVTSHEWPDFPSRYLLSRGIPDEQRTKWGLGYATYGRLDGRIVIPIRSQRGDLHSYHARTFVNAKRRYFYPSNEEHPNLDTLFGEQFWSQDRSVVVVTEGAFNGLAAERAYGGCIASIGGSQFRAAHAFRLATFKHVILLTDADAAGDKIASELTAALFRHTRVDRVRLPRDADETPRDDLRRILFGTLQQAV